MDNLIRFNTKDVGVTGENLAVEYLIRNGYTIVERNWVCGRYEIDIICMKDDDIVFVEVKAHGYNPLFDIRKMVGKDKQRRIIYSADKYLRMKVIDADARFDIIEVVLKGGGEHDIVHLENAFSVV